METELCFAPREIPLEPHQKSIEEIQTKLKKLKKSKDDKDFYRLVALLAKPDLKDFDENSAKTVTGFGQEFAASQFLETSYQEKSPIFVAQNQRMTPFSISLGDLATVSDKWQRVRKNMPSWLNHPIQGPDYFYYFDQPLKAVVRNGVVFSSKEVAELLMLAAKKIIGISLDAKNSQPSNLTSVMRFHSDLTDRMNKERWPLVMLGKTATDEMIVADRLRLFWSHRMRFKSWQTKVGALPSVRYFHAAFSSSGRPEHYTHVLYWLSYNEQNRPQHGNFIEGIKGSFIPQRLICPREIFENYRNDGEIDDEKFLLDMYLEASS
jgi:hypothetical protein